MTGFLIILCLALIVIITLQIGKVTDITNKIKGEVEAQNSNNRRIGFYFLVFLVVFLVACFASAIYYKNYMLGFGPHESASVHGNSLDSIFKLTLWVTLVVFVLTHIALFYFAWKYSGNSKRKAKFFSHDTKLEIIWTGIPAVTMALLVIGGLDAWNEVMADVSPDEEYMEIEATGYQFAWALRYPGPDGKLGSRDYQIINGSNPLGQEWTDEANWDDIHANEIVLPVGMKVRVKITARDVLHSFYLPHFRVKMDAVPGMPTYFVFTPSKTTSDYRAQLSTYPEYQIADPDDPEKQLWETFDYELACAELCGNGHFSMRKLVRVVEQAEYDKWLSDQNSYYLTAIRNTPEDPYNGDLLPFEIEERKEEFKSSFSKAMSSDAAADKIVRFKYVFFETGASELTPISRYELGNLADALKQNSSLNIELSGHTDNTGSLDINTQLSQARAKTVLDFLLKEGVDAGRLTSRGYGPNQPLGPNDTDEGRTLNRRTEFRILN
jgi:cytochrome c oxidase subunit 2